MNKAELATRIADRISQPKKVGEEIVALLEEIITLELMKGGEVTGFVRSRRDVERAARA